MVHERMTAADAVFLRLETPHEPQHVGSLSLFDGAPLRAADGAVRIDESCVMIARATARIATFESRATQTSSGPLGVRRRQARQ